MRSGRREAVRILAILGGRGDPTAEMEGRWGRQREGESEGEVREVMERLEAAGKGEGRLGVVAEMVREWQSPGGRVALAREVLALPRQQMKEAVGTTEGLAAMKTWILVRLLPGGGREGEGSKRLPVIESEGLWFYRSRGGRRVCRCCDWPSGFWWGPQRIWVPSDSQVRREGMNRTRKPIRV